MKVPLIVMIILFPVVSVAQKKVLSIPFEFEKKFLTAGDYDTYFLNNTADSVVSLVLKDNNKAEYVQLDSRLKVISKIDMDINSTVFNEDITEYRGGTTRANVFNFIYEEKEKKAFSRQVTVFQLETVDFNTKTVKHIALYEIPKAEDVVSSFSDNNRYYTITASDKTKELVFYVVNEAGVMKQQRIPFTVPDIAGKSRDRVSEYFNKLRVFKSNEEPDFSYAVSSAKLFCAPESLTFVINEAGHPVHLFVINLPDFNVKESFIDINNLKGDGKEKNYINSFKKDDQLFSLILNKKSIQIAIHNMTTGNLVARQEINDESNFGLFAVMPVTEKRIGKRADEKDVEDIKKLIKSLDKGTEGIMVSRNEKGQYAVTIGTYNLIPVSSGGSSGGYSGGWTPSSMATTPGISNHGATRTMVMKYDPYKYYRPGTPAYTTTNARYYTTTYFKVLLDSTGSKFVKGRLPTPVADQIKDYMELADPKAKATNQFSIGSKQYYGSYNRDTKSYVVEEIRLRK